jgi:hypothetical protein
MKKDQQFYILPSAQKKEFDSSDSLAIYSPGSNKDNIGPDSNQLRDCIDIAIKISMGMIGEEFDSKSIQEVNKVTEVISNNKNSGLLPVEQKTVKNAPGSKKSTISDYNKEAKVHNDNRKQYLTNRDLQSSHLSTRKGIYAHFKDDLEKKKPKMQI